jgi:hypothetical protein
MHMIESLQLALVLLAIILSLADVVQLGRKERRKAGHSEWIRRLAARQGLVIAALGCATFLGCLLVAGLFYEPVPRVQDEFSYLLMADTFAHGHLANPTPPLPEFFDTFHVLLHPAYVSKYYPAQGFFLAIGQKLTDHPAVGLWLSSALACAATCWMLQAWVGPVWGLMGGLLMAIQWGVFGYWSQSYWGGMAAALGGALCFGALRRLWDRLSWSSAVWFGVGAVVLLNSRPLEGICALVVAGGFFLYHCMQERHWAKARFWHSVVLPAGAVLLLGAAVTANYNRTITGSALTPPYVEHERQYQVTPAFIFLPMRAPITYSSSVLSTYYKKMETYHYDLRRNYWPGSTARNLGDWWIFYCEVLLSLPLVIPVLLRRGWIRYLQLAVLAGVIILTINFDVKDIGLGSLLDLLIVIQIVLLWLVFDGLWQHLAISITVLLMVIGSAAKWWFPHYTAPIACLCLFLQLDGLRRMWHWHAETPGEDAHLSQRERRRAAANLAPGQWNGATLRLGLRNLVYMFPVLCLLSLIGRVVLRKLDASPQFLLPDWGTLLPAKGDWALLRASMQRWLQRQSGSQLVFVHYQPSHWVGQEWVYNEADLTHSRVVWAHDKGVEHNRLLLQQMPGRTVWFVDADLPIPQLSPYSETERSVAEAAEAAKTAPNTHN